MKNLWYIKQGAESEFIFIDNDETAGTPVRVCVKKFFNSRPL